MFGSTYRLTLDDWPHNVDAPVADPELLDGDIDELEEQEEEQDNYDDGDEELPELVSDESDEEENGISGLGDTVHSFTWAKVADEVVHDQRVQDGFTTDTWQPRVRWDACGLDENVMKTGFLKYFLLFFPILLLPVWAAEMQSRGSARYGKAFLTGKRKLSVGLFLC
eukprot:gene19851-23747_t